MGRILLCCILALLGAAAPAAQDPERLGPEERAEIALLLRRGDLREARAICEEVLEADPGDAATRALLAACDWQECRYDEARAGARRALDLAQDPDARRAAGRLALAFATELGRRDEALALLGALDGVLVPDEDPRDAWAAASARLEAGEREPAQALARRGAGARAAAGWEALLARARCERWLGEIERAAATLVAADRAARAAQGVEPDVLVELGSVYFEAYGEVDDAVSKAHSPAELYREALEVAPRHEGARLGLFALGRFNGLRRRTPPEEILRAVLQDRPDSIEGLLAAAGAAVEDGALPSARTALARLEELAGGRRAVRTLRATLDWVEHDRDGARALLAALAAEDGADAVPEREVGRHLIALYRFAEALPFLEAAVERDERDFRAWTELGHALANTGDEARALEALRRAQAVAEGRRDAWRDNTALVLERMASTMVVEQGEALRFAWQPDAAFVLRTYLVPFYERAREELAQRYGFTPDPCTIEVFRRWRDFSVRSTGFEGFPALGVCFGPVVTAVSPLAEPRGTFSWARTSFHEFTHVIHLGLSHNRCPRWVTEGLATWEEGRANPAWWRNMRRDLLDARANGDVFPLRELNGAFRGPSVLFAYYQSGLVCRMLVERHGFPPMVRLLEAFDRGRDLDQAFAEVFATTPEEVDRDFARFVDELLAPLAIEPRWSPETTFRRRLALSRRPPEAPAERERWAREWCHVAWGTLGERKRVDAEEALRTAAGAGELPPQGLFLRAELALSDGDPARARALYEQGLAAGGEDFRARMALGRLTADAGELEQAERHLLAAERDFPGFEQSALSAELALASLYERSQRTEEAMAARRRWLSFNGGDYEERVRVATWLADEGRHEEALVLWQEANEVDPFRRDLHERWARSLAAQARWEEALRELDVALAVPWELEAEVQVAPEPPPPSPEWTGAVPRLHAARGEALFALGRRDEARAAAQAALALDPGNEAARAVLERAASAEPDAPAR